MNTQNKRFDGMHFLRTKATFMSFIIICSLFSIYLIAPAEARQNACCEKTTSGDYCVYTSLSNCDQNFNVAPTTCEQTQYCQPICCIDAETGVCHKNVGAAQCVEQGGSVDGTDPNCGVLQCQPGCCNIGNQYFLSTEATCKLAAAPYPNIDSSTIFNAGITNEQTCVAQATLKQEGCCVDSNTCSYTTGEQCTSGDFHAGTFCSNPNLGCNCLSQFEKRCIAGEEDVYWFDSCGNKEGIAEDCDYVSGTLCQNRNGQSSCYSVDCSSTVAIPGNPHDPVLESGGPRKHGESWCSYESGVGDFLDRPGSRHYRHVCINGEELVQECRDYREEVCVQATSQSGLNVGNCLNNEIYGADVTVNVSTVPRGQQFWDGSNELTCETGTTECTVVWAKKSAVDDWDCEYNCFCEQVTYLNDMAGYCATKGDCGADLNILDRKTTYGLEVSWIGTDKGERPDEIDDGFWFNRTILGMHGGMLGLQQFMEDVLATQPDIETGLLSTDVLAVGAVAATVATIVVVGLQLSGVAVGSFFAGTGLAPLLGLSVSPFGLVLVAVIIILAVILGNGDSKDKTATVACLPWVPPVGSDDCDKCDDDPRYQKSNYDNPATCSEYRCRSLGTACELVNQGTGEAKCVGRNLNDPNSPIISPLQRALTQGYSLRALPNGYEIVPDVKPYERITFGIETDEPAECKFDTAPLSTFDEMSSFFGTNLFAEEFNVSLSLEGGNDYTYYLRCQDINGNTNDNPYIIKLSVGDEPDHTPPVIESTSLPSGSSISHTATETELTVYLNEPGKSCRWNKGTDIAFEDMPLENLFVCSSPPNNPLVSTLTHPCRGLLTNVQPSIDNAYYIRCQDLADNTNQQGHPLTLYGTTELLITSTAPSGELYTTSPTLQVTTQGGAEDGSATCFYKGAFSNAITFLNTYSNVHTQPLTDLVLGDYQYTVDCSDIAGNTATETVSFSVNVDTNYPQVVNLYSDGTTLHLITDEPSACAYSTSTKSFTQTQGNPLTGDLTEKHSLTLSSSTYHIICWDVYDNAMPAITVYT